MFIGSCTNGRIEDLREVARVAKGKKVSSPSVYAMIVPGSGLVKEQAEAEGLDKIFKEAGFDWREAGCSMCLGMNPDQLKPRRALRLHLQPQLRGPPGPLRPHAPGLAGHGRRGRDRRAFRGCAEVWVMSSRRLHAPANRPGSPGSIIARCSGARGWLGAGDKPRHDSLKPYAPSGLSRK